jgi:hypothetical protein
MIKHLMNDISVWQLGQKGIGKQWQVGDLKSDSVPRGMDADLKLLFEEHEVHFDERINKVIKTIFKRI